MHSVHSFLNFMMHKRSLSGFCRYKIERQLATIFIHEKRTWATPKYHNTKICPLCFIIQVKTSFPCILLPENKQLEFRYKNAYLKRTILCVSEIQKMPVFVIKSHTSESFRAICYGNARSICHARGIVIVTNTYKSEMNGRYLCNTRHIRFKKMINCIK